VGDNQEAKKEVKAFNPDSVFSTPKPERLIERILTLGSKPVTLSSTVFSAQAPLPLLLTKWAGGGLASSWATIATHIACRV
jgi:hypothetical protein